MWKPLSFNFNSQVQRSYPLFLCSATRAATHVYCVCYLCMLCMRACAHERAAARAPR